jgi:hypothetical protein
MNLIKRLLGGGGGGAETSKANAVDYNGYTITPKPMTAEGGYRIAALIEKDAQSHQLIRADTIRDLEEAQTASIAKAKQVIDEQGDRIFV